MTRTPAVIELHWRQPGGDDEHVKAMMGGQIVINDGIGPSFGHVAAVAETPEEVAKDRDYWRKVALYLADCHAATGEHEACLKSTPAGQKRRFASICRLAANLLSKTGELPLHFDTNAQMEGIESIVERCKRGAKAGP